MDDSTPKELEMLSDETNETLLKNRKHLSPRIEKYHKAVKESLELSDFNIKEKALIAANIQHGWVTTLFSEQAYLRELKEKLEKAKDIVAAPLKSQGTPTWKIGDMLQSNPKLKQIESKIVEQEEIVRYLTETVKIVKDLGWHLKTAAELIKLEN